MKKGIKKFICILISVLMLCTLPAFASAEKTGLCGENVSYSLDAEGNLTLTGTGETYDAGENGFFNDMIIKTLTVSEGITAIGKNFFRALPELTTVTFPSSLKKTGYASFFRCPKLRTVNFGDGIEIIGPSSFSDCYEIKEIVLPDSVEFIDTYAFKNCKGIEKLTLGKGLRDVESHAFYICNSLKELTLPDSLIYIGEYAFANLTSLEKLTMGNSVEYIGQYGFHKAANLQEVTLPASLKTLSTMAFSYCDKLKKVNFPDYIPYFDILVFSHSPYDNIKPGGFKFAGKMIIGYNAPAPETLDIPEGTLGIAGYVFCNNSDLKSVTLPEGIRSLGMHCFDNCTALAEINFPDSLEYIQPGALNNTEYINFLPDGELYINHILMYYKGTMPEDYHLNVPEGTKSISQSAFSGEKTLTEVTLPSSLKSVENYAFYDCSGLKKVNTPASGPEYIGEFAFSSNPELSSFTVPSTVKKIDRYAFYKCPVLKDVNYALDEYNCRVPTYIESYAFYDCEALDSFTFPYSTEDSNYYIFYDKILSSVTVANPELVPDKDIMGISKKTVITGFKGSEAEKFAKESGCAFRDIEEGHTHSFGKYKTVKAPTATEDGLMESRCTCGKVQTKIIPKGDPAGDVDEDGRITASDARLALRASVALETLTDGQKARADLDGDKKITAADARLILRKSVGL